MRKLAILFILIFFTYAVQSQSLTEKEITGTWQVVNVLDEGTKPTSAPHMKAAYFDLYPDGSFQLRMKRFDRPTQEYENNIKNQIWSFNQATQTITLNNDKFPIKVYNNNGTISFELLGTGIKLEVVKPN